MKGDSKIAKWYKGKAVFITGGTGFMGKVLVEKLLRSCPDIGTIFLLVREQKNTSPFDRVQKMLTSPLFDKVRVTGTNLMERIAVISGDVSLPGLGISAEDRCRLQNTVSAVFHVAATVKFHEPLRIAVAMNIEGTKAVLQLCEGMRSLAAVVHVSTAYVHQSGPVVQERVYSPPSDLQKVEHCLAGLDDDLLQFVTPRLIQKHQNTYTFTKALAEHVVAEYSNKLPIVVVRPSIVTASWREPISGWVDSFNGPASLIACAGKGLMKIVFGKKETVADLMPVDTCINLFIAAAWELGNREGMKLLPDILVYNCVSGPINPVTWGLVVEEISKSVKQYTMSNIIMSPEMILTDSRVKQTLYDLVYQAAPAGLVDCFTKISGGTPRFQRYRRQMKKVAEQFEYFLTHDWNFDVGNVERLKNHLSPVDRKTFDFDVEKLIWKEYIAKYVIGVRRDLLHDPDDTMDRSRKRASRLALLSNISHIGILVILVFGIFRFFDVSFESDLQTDFTDLNTMH